MTCETLIASAVACLALSAAAPAAADEFHGTPLFPETVPGAGLSGVAGAQATIARTIHGSGATATALFAVRKNRLIFVDKARSLRFRSLHVIAVRFGANDATLRGVGLLNGRRVGFTARAVHNAMPGVDVLRVSVGNRAGLGGRILRGGIFIR
jgi:hypothetical protein